MAIDWTQFDTPLNINDSHLYSKGMFDNPEENKEIDSSMINMLMDICSKTIGIDMAPYPLDFEIDSDLKKLNKKRKR